MENEKDLYELYYKEYLENKFGKMYKKVIERINNSPDSSWAENMNLKEKVLEHISNEASNYANVKIVLGKICKNFDPGSIQVLEILIVERKMLFGGFLDKIFIDLINQCKNKESIIKGTHLLKDYFG